ncbi:MAG TPA: hypothetical protein P5527_00400, partial [Kiritimatiellia bacterium]|nr:hypothetical protein [Kiritimatiellia bacterium]
MTKRCASVAAHASIIVRRERQPCEWLDENPCLRKKTASPVGLDNVLFSFNADAHILRIKPHSASGCVTHTGAEKARGLDPWVVLRHSADVPGDILKGHGDAIVTAHGNHDVVFAGVDEFAGHCAEPGAEQPVGRGGGATTLDVTELGHARIDAGELLEVTD